MLLVALFLPELGSYTDQYTVAALIPHVLSMGLILWEPFFVYGWLQLRFERAFGVIPGILLAGGSFGLYHVGTYSMVGVMELAFFGAMFAVIFHIGRSNLLALWPLTWAVAASIGTLGRFEYDWWAVGTSLLLLVVTAIGIHAIVRKRDRSGDLMGESPN